MNTSQAKLTSFVAGAALLGLVAVPACHNDTSTALGVAELCDNGADDDGDGLADCDDPDCTGHLACRDRMEFLCDNGADDDGDGLTDCDDPDCAQDPVCQPEHETSCADGVDNDSDGLADCADPDCQATPDCKELCADGIDNDLNGLVDCADPHCAGAPACQGQFEQMCDDGLDNDGDGLADCDDPDCAGADACQPPAVEICDDYDSNGFAIDNDGDGLANCADPDCRDQPSCAEWICTNGGDDDHDGHVDCEDSDCQGTSACDSDPTCQSAQLISCNESRVGSTRGRPNSITSYAGCGVSGELGGEQVYEFDPGSNGPIDGVVVSLWSPDGNPPLDLFVIGGSQQMGCDSEQFCRADTYPGTDGTKEIGFYPMGHQQERFFIVVDSQNSQGSPYALWVTCGSVDGQEICNNYDQWGQPIDDDDDGFANCWDPDCAQDPACQYWVSGGISCENDSFCPPNEYCRDITLQGVGNLSQGVCTRDCQNPSDCWNPDYQYGACVASPSDPNQQFCVQLCGTDPWGGGGGGWVSGDCPEGTTCATQNGTPTSNSGVCLPL